jgi:RNA polymerase sigma-70 factor (ECF subfamily)
MMHSREDDLLVIRSVLQGRQSDFAILVQRYSQYVFTLAFRFVPVREVAEELAQDAFVKAYTNLAGFRGESKFSTWLYTIVHTTCLSYLRRKNNSALLLDEEMLTQIYDQKYHSQPTHRSEQNSQRMLLDKVIGQLPANEAEVICLFYQAGQSVEEISVITGATTANVKVRLYRARQKLKDIIEQCYKKELIE